MPQTLSRDHWDLCAWRPTRLPRIIPLFLPHKVVRLHPGCLTGSRALPLTKKTERWGSWSVLQVIAATEGFA